MLHWLAGAKPHEPSDPDATGYVEPPETPAPVFAVRAFKHAIFGTPQTVQPKARRNSNTENTRSRNTNPRPERPTMTRPKSAGDARALGLGEGQRAVPEPMASPTKGILMTPGTAAAKRKTVTFGEQVMDNEEKRPIKSGLPDDCPGKFPSPWTKPNVEDKDDEEANGSGRARPRSKLTEALEQVRDESAKRKRSEKRDEIEQIEHAGADEPQKECCKQWKAQFDAYREKSQRDVKKLIQKQKMAKDFARDKDVQCTDLSDQLRQERKKVDRLERRTAELEMQIKDMQQRLAKDTTSGLKSEMADIAAKSAPVASQHEHGSGLNAKQVEEATTVQPSRLATMRKAQKKENILEREPQSQGLPDKETNVTTDTLRAKARTRPESGRTGTNDDIWNQALRSSSPAWNPDKANPALHSSRMVTSGTDLTPLKSLNINTLPTAKLTRRDSAQPSPPNGPFAKELLVRQEVVPSQVFAGDKRTGSPLLPTATDTRASNPQEVLPRSPSSPTSRKAADVAEDLTMPVPASSPFMNTPGLSPVSGSPKRSYFDRRENSPSKATSVPVVKEDAPPAVKPAPPAEKVKPTAAWNAINTSAVPAARRTTSMTTRDGRQVSADRLEAAKARMAARGRIVS